MRLGALDALQGMPALQTLPGLTVFGAMDTNLRFLYLRTLAMTMGTVLDADGHYFRAILDLEKFSFSSVAKTC